MNSVERPSIGGVLKPLDKSTSVKEKAANYLRYYDSTKDRDEIEAKRRQNPLDVTNSYYDLATDFYEYGWGESFHFAVINHGESREHAFAKHEYTLALKLKLQPGEQVLVSVVDVVVVVVEVICSRLI